jgi:anaerobic selenocysteine-containing dehydrogenase
VIVEVEEGRLKNVTGAPDNPVFAGYTCIKGRAQPEIGHDPSRLLHSQKRESDGTYRPISSAAAMDEIAAHLIALIDRHGPGTISSYLGTMAYANPLIMPFHLAFMDAIASPMVFTSNTIDKPGRNTANALHGRWMAPPQGYDRPDAALLFGLNSFQSYYGMASGNPAKWLSERLRDGMQLIVIDPRKTDIAKRANLHIQPVPGEDPAILACLINVIIRERRYDEEFVTNYVDGLDRLAEAVRPFTPEAVARRADVRAEDLVSAARVFSTGRGYAAAGVGPGFAACSTLVHYLILNLEALCGHYLRAGEQVKRTVVLMPPVPHTAQVAPPKPAWGYGTRLRIRGLGETAAGLPTGVLPDEILLEGEGQIKALISNGGNPVSAWPDQLKTLKAMQTLELLVQIDPWMSSTARQAHYVIAPTMPYEVPSATFIMDALVVNPHWYGPDVAYGQYTPAIVEPPTGSDVIDEWGFFFGLARRMDLNLDLSPYLPGPAKPEGLLNRTELPTSDELLDLMARGSRISLDEVKLHPNGGIFVDPPDYVVPGDPDSTDRLDVANETMMQDLARILTEEAPGHHGSGEYPFRIVGRRVQRTFNSSQNFPATNRGRGYNPAYMHPTDLEYLALRPGDAIEIASRVASICAVVDSDPTLRQGLISMTHCYGDTPERDDEFRLIGSPTNRLLDSEDFTDPYIGMPRIGAVPVAVRPLNDRRRNGPA